MTSIDSKLKTYIDDLPDPRLVMWVISCHVDKPLTGDVPESVYNIPLQAGAALTDIRTCEFNDFDGDEESISDRNQRYSEGTAMQWIGRHLMSEYVGITHYRRRFRLDDKQLKAYLDDGFDIITTEWYDLPERIDEGYREAYYGADWQLFMDIIEEYAPEDVELAKEQFAMAGLHPCNLGIYRKEIYEEYASWMFPMLDAFYQRSPLKTDRYLRRDVGFIAERLTSLFVEKKKLKGARVIEAPFYDLKSKDWTPTDACDVKDPIAVYNTACELYKQEQIMRAGNVVAACLKTGNYSKEVLELAEVFGAASAERRVLRETMFEYLPIQWRGDLRTLHQAYMSLKGLVNSILQEETDEKYQMLNQFVEATGFSDVVLDRLCQSI